MKIGIMSDSHENMPQIAKAVELFNKEQVGLVFHAGDIISPITAKEFGKLQCKLIAVLGNNDGEKLMLKEKFKLFGEIYERSYVTEIEGKKVLLCHEDNLVESLIKSQEFDIIIYGHTHKINIRQEGKTLIINPGEVGGWLLGKSTVVVLETEKWTTQAIDL